MNKLIILLFLSIHTILNGACTTNLGSGTCVADSTNGCHIPVGTSCRNPDTPDGCKNISCNSSCPSAGYYAPYGNSAAWNAFVANKPSTVTIANCSGGSTKTTLSTGSSGSSSSSTTSSSCLADGTVCNTDSSLYAGMNPCASCCNSAGAPGVQCSGGSNHGVPLGACGAFQVTCPQSFCSDGGGSCVNY